MIAKLLSATALACLATISSTASAQSGSGQKAPTADPAQPQSQPKPPSSKPEQQPTSKQPTADRSKLIEEAVTAVRETRNAVRAIDQNKPADAISALERATGKLEIVLARTPDLALAPIDDVVITYDVIGTVQDVERIRAAAKAAFDRGRMQEARRLMDGLASETVLSVTNMPLGTYPAALKEAAALLHQGKPQDAKRVLETALNTFVVTRTIMPLPLARAQSAIEEGRTLMEKSNRTDAESARLGSLLARARDQLRLGQALGYATEKEMSDLVRAVEDMERRTSGKQQARGIVEPTRPMFDAANKASQPPKSN